MKEGVVQNIFLPGQHRDDVFNTYYNRYRYYDAVIGSYREQDPIGLSGGWNKVRYVDKPLQFFDPIGQQWSSSIPIFNGGLPGNQGALSEAMKGPPPPIVLVQPIPISISFETNGAIQGIFGKSGSEGKVFGIRRDFSIIDCTYSSACDLLGLGLMYGGGVGVGITNDAPSTGVATSTGGVIAGGALGSASVQGTTDDSSGATTFVIGAAVGEGFSVSKLTCKTNTRC